MRARILLLGTVILVQASGCTFLDLSSVGSSRAQGPGSAYRAFLGPGTDTVVVELDHSPGAGFDGSTPARDQFVSELERITDKDVVVRSRDQLPGKGPDYAYSLDELVDLHETYQDEVSGNGTQVMHALFLEGELRGSVAGLAFAPRAFAVFKGQIEESTCENDARTCRGSCPTMDPTCLRRASPAVREYKLTRSVALHEAGHLLGLVDSPLPMVEPHEMEQDPRPGTERLENASHSANESSVMFWRLEDAEQATELLDDDYADGGEIPWRFGRLDVADARAVGEG